MEPYPKDEIQIKRMALAEALKAPGNAMMQGMGVDPNRVSSLVSALMQGDYKGAGQQVMNNARYAVDQTMADPVSAGIGLLGMTAYHGGTVRDLNQFLPKNRMDNTGMAWASVSKDYARKYGDVSKVNLDIKNPFDVRNDLKARELYDRYVEENGAVTGPSMGGVDPKEGYAANGLPYYENNDAVSKIASDHNYDAILTAEHNDNTIGIGLDPKKMTIYKSSRLKKRE